MIDFGRLLLARERLDKIFRRLLNGEVRDGLLLGDGSELSDGGAGLESAGDKVVSGDGDGTGQNISAKERLSRERSSETDHWTSTEEVEG